jgi:hypothetical protein
VKIARAILLKTASTTFKNCAPAGSGAPAFGSPDGDGAHARTGGLHQEGGGGGSPAGKRAPTIFGTRSWAWNSQQYRRNTAPTGARLRPERPRLRRGRFQRHAEAAPSHRHRSPFGTARRRGADRFPPSRSAESSATETELNDRDRRKRVAARPGKPFRQPPSGAGTQARRR